MPGGGWASTSLAEALLSIMEDAMWQIPLCIVFRVRKSRRSWQVSFRIYIVL